ncbi:hypothetical protein LP415_00075 [Polaromonas sp. P1(28)-8]|nr:hypothetical protein LP415_00075 [Polaromonas sp. P1(28)-8]
MFLRLFLRHQFLAPHGLTTSRQGLLTLRPALYRAMAEAQDALRLSS